MMMKFLLVCLSVLLLSAQAQASCYSGTEAEAEQGIRIHSELMVVGLNCTHMGKRIGWDLYGDYRKFTARHADLFAGYETTMMSYFNRNGGSAESKMNGMRTRFANKISKDAASMRPDVFCANNAERMRSVTQMTRDQLRQWAATVYPSHPVSKPVCAGGR